MSEMVERVAKAIAHLRMCELQGNVVPCNSCKNARGYNDDVGCITLARAAIEAMREPTAEMLTFSSFKSADDLYRYQAMIDAALK